MPQILTEAAVADFRDRLCAAAERLFVERGADSVTMRQLAAELGVSPMTPYRYFQDKDEILATVRTHGFNRLADALEQARASARSPRARGAAVAEAYLAFAFAHPHTYKLMFDLNDPVNDTYPDLAEAGRRSRENMVAWVNDVIEAGEVAGDAEEIGRMFWAATHGAVVLEMAGMLPEGAARATLQRLRSTLARGLRPDA